jgi:hypothetical protein
MTFVLTYAPDTKDKLPPDLNLGVARHQYGLNNISRRILPNANILWRGFSKSTIVHPAIEAGDAANATAVVRKALSALKEFKFRTDRQEAEWRTHAISFHLGADPCDAVCARAGGRACVRDWFILIDQCPVAQAVFPQGRCSAAPRPSAPGFDGERMEVTVSSNGRLDPPSCGAAPGPADTRLCPCAPAGHARAPPPAPGLAAVRRVVEGRLAAAAAAAARAAGGGNGTAAAARDEPPHSPAVLLRNVKVRARMRTRGGAGGAETPRGGARSVVGERGV